ncbi:hypothetical protein HZI73_18770 [Vallitalea pronyensis]|uniref:Uncharacterized protein n=1 Tax=Vallitalea pronyensis TaxID=1348613 RepID=A0A8J8SI91_9FIRM|nr:hypothetical protein [Vallitalea pronyensis]QUI24209.1 hypothetical protein HZI73_18770 [Vallitalea pronyensis]
MIERTKDSTLEDMLLKIEPHFGLQNNRIKYLKKEVTITNKPYILSYNINIYVLQNME